MLRVAFFVVFRFSPWRKSAVRGFWVLAAGKEGGIGDFSMRSIENR